jgi:YesN/AraC family two-component response regulator
MINIMLVEDNIHARRALKALISQQEGINVIAEASNGQEAICKIEAQVPTLMIMDMRMPVMDGLETTRIVKARWEQVKIIILSMYTDSQSAMLAAGADSFLAKGCSIETIVSVIRSLTSTPSPGASPFEKKHPQIA